MGANIGAGEVLGETRRGSCVGANIGTGEVLGETRRGSCGCFCRAGGGGESLTTRSMLALQALAGQDNRNGSVREVPEAEAGGATEDTAELPAKAATGMAAEVAAGFALLPRPAQTSAEMAAAMTAAAFASRARPPADPATPSLPSLAALRAQLQEEVLRGPAVSQGIAEKRLAFCKVAVVHKRIPLLCTSRHRFSRPLCIPPAHHLSPLLLLHPSALHVPHLPPPSLPCLCPPHRQPSRQRRPAHQRPRLARARPSSRRSTCAGGWGSRWRARLRLRRRRPGQRRGRRQRRRKR